MKSVYSLIVIFVSIMLTMFSCQTQPDKPSKTIGVYNEGDCLLSKISFDYPNMKVEIELAYDNNNVISDLTRSVNGIVGRKPSIQYNDVNQLAKFDVHHEDSLSYYETYFWEKDRVIMSHYGFEEGKWINHNKISVNFNEFGEMVSLDDFFVDSLGVWSRKGTLYDFEWNNGNVEKIKNYIVEDSKSRGIDISTKDHYFMVSIDEEEYIVDNYSDLVEYYTTTFEYSEDKNPVHLLSISNLIAPNNFNCSRNLPTKKTQTYANGDVITLVFSWIINDRGFPTSGIVKAKVEAEGQFAETEYKVNFEYTNCK